MGNGLVPFGKRNQLARQIEQIEHELTRQTGEIQRIADVTKVAMDELGETFGHAEFKAASTLAAVNIIRQTMAAAGNNTPDYEASCSERTQIYLEQMADLVQQASKQIVQVTLNGRRR